MSEREEWRPLFDWPYEISSLGRVRGHSGRLINGWRHLGRYWAVKLKSPDRYKTLVLHALVAKVFHGPKPSPRHVVCHWDGDGTNNVAANLRWGTPEENEADKLRHGRRLWGERINTARFTLSQVIAIRESTEGTGVLADRFGVNRTTITDIRMGHTWRLAA